MKIWLLSLSQAGGFIGFPKSPILTSLVSSSDILLCNDSKKRHKCACVRLHTLSPALFKPVVVIAVSCDSLAPSSLICWCLWTRVPLYVFLIQETGTHHSSGSRGIPSRPDTFISVKKETEQTRAAVCSILPGGKKREGDWRGGEKKKKKFFECAEGMRCLALNEKSAVEKIQRGNFTPAYEPGSE